MSLSKTAREAEMEEIGEKRYQLNEEEWTGHCLSCGEKASEHGMRMGGTATTYDMGYDCHHCGAVLYVTYSKGERL